MTYGHSDSPFAWAQKPHPSLRSGPRRRRAVCAANAAFRHASRRQHCATSAQPRRARDLENHSPYDFN